MARRSFQQGSLFQRGTRRKVWVGRWWEDVIQADGTIGRMRRSSDVLSVPAQGFAAGDFAGFLRIIRNGVSYVNIHTPTFPAGEIRGQIRVVEEERENDRD